MPPLDFVEANELVKTSLARRGFASELPTDQSFVQGRGDGRGNVRLGGGGGAQGVRSTTRRELKLNGKSVCYLWNNHKPCIGTLTADGCKGQSGEERLHRCSWVDNNKLCGKDHKKREHKP